jgi:hypothetical protein
MTKRWHVIAHGSDEYPNLDVEVEFYPEGLLYKYPFISIQRIKPDHDDRQVRRT